MHLQPKGNSNPYERFHVPSGIGKALIATGVVEEVTHAMLEAEKPYRPVRWWVGFLATGDTEPVIFVSCPNCGKNEHTTSVKGTAHTAKFFHCTGYQETCPKDVAEKYLKFWADHVRLNDIKPKKKFYQR